MAKNTKTPVMVLQEFTVKNALPPPQYELVYCQEGTHENEFHYRLCVQDNCVIGKGKSKKEAKHDAANLVLEMLDNEGALQADDREHYREVQKDLISVRTPVNCIPQLFDLCAERKIPEPEFVEISAIGLSHCREFTYECRIASIKTRATAGSKKHAKQYAAKEMLDRIVSVIPDVLNNVEVKEKNVDDVDDAVQKFINLRMLTAQTDLNAKPFEFGHHIKNLMKEKGITLNEIKEYFNKERNEENLSRLLHIFDYKFHINIIQEKGPPVMCLYLTSSVPVSVMKQGDFETSTRDAVVEIFNILETLIFN